MKLHQPGLQRLEQLRPEGHYESASFPKRLTNSTLRARSSSWAFLGTNAKKRKSFVLSKKTEKRRFLRISHSGRMLRILFISSLRMFRSGWMGHDYCAACFVFGCVLITTFLFSFFFLCKFDWHLWHGAYWCTHKPANTHKQFSHLYLRFSNSTFLFSVFLSCEFNTYLWHGVLLYFLRGSGICTGGESGEQSVWGAWFRASRMTLRIFLPSSSIYMFILLHSCVCVSASEQVYASPSSSILVHIYRHCHVYCLCYVLYLFPCFCVFLLFPKLNRPLCHGVRVYWCNHTYPYEGMSEVFYIW